MIFNGIYNMIWPISKGYFHIVLLALLLACQPSEDQTADTESQDKLANNPPAEGFNSEQSDAEAVEIADQVMIAMGGRSAWDATRYVAWDFFGARKLIWDKHNGDVRIDFPDSTIYLVNVNDGSGKVHKHGVEITHPDSLAKELDRGKRIWINDSYWLVMPFKLKDSGVTLKYIGSDTTQAGNPSRVLELTFNEVGVTPQNKYLVYIDSITHLVNQWAFYRKADQDSANFILPWSGYEKHGEILLSSSRGERSLSEVMVLDSLPTEVFTLFKKVDLSQYQ